MNPTVRSEKSKALERRPEEAPGIPWTEPKLRCTNILVNTWLIEIVEIRSALATLEQLRYILEVITDRCSVFDLFKKN